jgi:paired amphipathic helix protein Sin3a
LILGFNAFLPKTHHIDPNIQDFSRWAQNLPGASSHSEAPGAASYAPVAPVQAQQYARPPGYAAVQPSPYIATTPVSIQPSAGAAASAAVASSIPAVGPSTNVARGTNIQFNRAVSFVEKIKTRFANQPETYRSFLSLLHSFHRDQRGIKDVYIQVQQLFRNEPDLLEEFSLFLPDNSSSTTSTTAAPSSALSRAIPGSMLPPVGRFPSSNTPVITASGVVSGPRQGVASHSQKRASGGIQIPQSVEKPKRARAHEIYDVTKTTDETEFFEKVKKYLGSRQVYADFLKCLSLFSQDILKLPDLINMVHGFIGGNEDLFSWFKRYINFKESDMKLLDISSGSSRVNRNANAGSFAEAQVPELNLSALKRVGCYRIYPRGYRLCKASGRTVLCDEVLNDELVSCAVFESEDSGFVSSKKNQYEDALFKCEDERFEMDLILEYNLSTIAVLEPIAKRIEKMTAEEREAFRLDHRLNGTSEVIYKKAIKRIYGDKADDIYEYLQKSPCAALPVVLKRLKAKDEEWRRVQRDWNRVWAEIHIKNYYKALDHQGIDFKVTDRKTLTTRSLVNEIQVIKEERKRIKERSSNNSMIASSSPHMTQVMTDSSLLKDLLNLVEITIRSSASFSGVDRKSLSRFFSTFVPEFFRIETCQIPSEIPVSSSAAQTDGESDDEKNKMMTDDSSNDSKVNRKASLSNLLLYANDSLFAFVRIFMIAYERLERLKQAQASQNRPFFTEKTNVVAQFLDLHSRQSTMTVDEEMASGRDFYGVLLYLLEQLIDGEIEPGLFEEKVRYMFGTSGYLIFTFDKVLLSLLRQTLAVLNDASCENLIRLYDSWRSRKGPRTSEYSARLAAENIVNDSNLVNGGGNGSSPVGVNLYRIELNLMKRQLTIHLVDRLAGGGVNNSSAGTIEEKWSNYVDNFVKLESNPVYLNPKSRPFLTRTRGSQSMSLKHVSILYNLECKICINTYKIFYVENTEDLLVKRVRTAPIIRKNVLKSLEKALKTKF